MKAYFFYWPTERVKELKSEEFRKRFALHF